MSDLQSFLDSGTSFEGKVAFTGVVRIDGHFRGEANADGTLVVGETGTVEADLDVSSLVVQGTYRGNVHAKEVIEVASTGVVEGSVTTARLLIADGAQINASINMGERRTPPPPDPPGPANA